MEGGIWVRRLCEVVGGGDGGGGDDDDIMCTARIFPNAAYHRTSCACAIELYVKCFKFIHMGSAAVSTVFNSVTMTHNRSNKNFTSIMLKSIKMVQCVNKRQQRESRIFL